MYQIPSTSYFSDIYANVKNSLKRDGAPAQLSGHGFDGVFYPSSYISSYSYDSLFGDNDPHKLRALAAHPRIPIIAASFANTSIMVGTSERMRNSPSERDHCTSCGSSLSSSSISNPIFTDSVSPYYGLTPALCKLIDGFIVQYSTNGDLFTCLNQSREEICIADLNTCVNIARFDTEWNTTNNFSHDQQWKRTYSTRLFRINEPSVDNLSENDNLSTSSVASLPVTRISAVESLATSLYALSLKDVNCLFLFFIVLKKIFFCSGLSS
jgi:hypothetical protein